MNEATLRRMVDSMLERRAAMLESQLEIALKTLEAMRRKPVDLVPPRRRSTDHVELTEQVLLPQTAVKLAA
jgi:hypothetical protein